jgi:hypothetical protein
MSDPTRKRPGDFLLRVGLPEKQNVPRRLGEVETCLSARRQAELAMDAGPQSDAGKGHRNLEGAADTRFNAWAPSPGCPTDTDITNPVMGDMLRKSSP